MNKETIELSGVIVRETALAILFSDGIVEEWLPKSQIETGDPDPRSRDTGNKGFPEYVTQTKE